MRRFTQIPFFLLFLTFSLTAGALLAQPSMKDLEKSVAASFEKFETTGLAVAVVKDGKVVWKVAMGTKNAEKKEKMDTQALFSIASCSKAFTAAGVALLVQEGRLKWTDKVIDYIPGFQLADPCITSQLTVEDLLCHRSGLGTFYGDLLWYGTEYTNAEIIARMRHLPLTQQFRSQFGYQNNMYMLAGEVIEKVSGRTWSQFMQERFFGPLDMTTTKPSNDELKTGDNIAMGHIEGAMIDIYDFNAVKPAASIYSSVEDLSNWMRMLLDGGKWGDKEILSAQTVRSLFSPQTMQGLSPTWESWGVHFRAYGLGWGMFDYSGRKIVEHNGGMPGYISKVCVVPEENLGIVVLNNGMDGLVNDVVRWKVLDAFFGGGKQDWDAAFMDFKKRGKAWETAQKEKRAQNREQGTQPSVVTDAFLGTYVDKMYGEATVKLAKGTEDMYLTLEPTKGLFTGQLEHWHYNTFKVQFRDPFLTYGLVTFEQDEKGLVKGFKIDLPSNDFHFFNLDFKKTE